MGLFSGFSKVGFVENYGLNKNAIKMENIKVTLHQRVFSMTVFSDFLKFLKSSWTNENFDYPPGNEVFFHMGYAK